MRDGDTLRDNNKKKEKFDEKKNMEMYTELSTCCKKVFQAMSLSGVVSSAAPEGDELELEWIHGMLYFQRYTSIRYKIRFIYFIFVYILLA